MKARVHVFYKDSVFDPQGNAVCMSLRKLGFAKVNAVRMGRAIDIDFEGNLSEDSAKTEVKKMCEKLLVNPVIEAFQIEFP